jgi:hypothetical protein
MPDSNLSPLTVQPDCSLLSTVLTSGMRMGFWLENQKDRPLRRLGCRWENNIKMDLREIG